MECSCNIDACCDGDTYEACEEKIITHAVKSVNITCGECGRKIALGEDFEWYRGEYDGERHTHHTCMDCLSLRQHFFGDWTFEKLWEDFKYHMDICDWQVPEKCLAKATATTRAKICEMIERYWRQCDEAERTAVG